MVVGERNPVDKIKEIIPDDIPAWAQDAIDEGQLWKTVFDRITKLQAVVDEQPFKHSAYCRTRNAHPEPDVKQCVCHVKGLLQHATKEDV